VKTNKQSKITHKIKKETAHSKQTT